MEVCAWRCVRVGVCIPMCRCWRVATCLPVCMCGRVGVCIPMCRFGRVATRGEGVGCHYMEQLRDGFGKAL